MAAFNYWTDKGTLHKLTISIIFIFLSSFLSAQKRNFTKPLVNEKFIRHRVLPGQTFNSIGKLYNVSSETLSAYNYLENYKGRVIALYLKVPLTKSNFTNDFTAKANRAFVPVYHVKGNEEGLVKRRQAKAKNKALLAWSNTALRSRASGSLPVIGYLQINSKHASLFETIKPLEIENGNLAEPPAIATNTNIAPPGITDSIKAKALVKPVIDENDTVKRKAAVNAAISHKQFTGKNLRVVRIPSEEKIIPFIALLILCNLSLVLVIFLYLSIKKKNYFFKVETSEKIRGMLTGTLLAETDKNELQAFCKAWQKWLERQKQPGMTRQLLINEIINGKKSLKGNASLALVKLYEHLKLNDVSLNKLKGKNWKKKIEGLHELSMMEQVKSLPDITIEMKSANLYVRMEAQSAVVHLSGYDGLQFLDGLRYPISDWQQIKLIEQLTKITGAEMVSFDRWLQSTNDSVIIFTLKLIGVFKQRILHDKVELLLHDKKPIVRLQAIKCLFEIYNEHTAAILQGVYNQETKNNKILILNILGVIGCEDQQPFLLMELENQDNAIKLAAANAFAKCSNNGLQLLDDYRNNKSQLYEQIFFHVQEGLQV